jgi:hypothetical protein
VLQRESGDVYADRPEKRIVLKQDRSGASIRCGLEGGLEVTRAVVPAGRTARGVGRHDFAIGRDALAMKRGLHEPALAQPAIALGNDKPVAQETSQHANARSLYEIVSPSDHYLFDRIWMVDQKSTARPKRTGTTSPYSRAQLT